MKVQLSILVLFFTIFLLSCQDSEVITSVANTTLYFPPINSVEWKKEQPENLGWNTTAIHELNTFLKDSNTRAFLILKNGKIVLEEYWGNTFLNTGNFTSNSKWYWASAGKTLSASLIGIAVKEGKVSVNDKTSDYLGKGWTSLTPQKEDLITIKNNLTMTTGLDYNVVNPNCYTPDCFQYNKDAGSQWYYHNGPYTILKEVIENTYKTTYNEFTEDKLQNRIGMNGEWVETGTNNLYWSTARDAARFGVLLSNKGKWDGNELLTSTYFNEMTNSSQAINPSYGYLTWLNGKSSIQYPGSEVSFTSSLSENAPKNMFAALGKNGQIIAVVPDENIVVIRLGEAPSNDLVPVTYHNELWKKINAIIN